MDKSKPGIYQIQHLASGKFYVGSAKHIGRRWVEHVRDLRAGSHHSKKMQNAWNKYGQSAFAFSILEIVEDPSNLIEREQHWLDKTQAVKLGYNNSPVAGSLLGFRHKEETKKKMSLVHTGRIRSEEHRRNLSIANTGKKMSEEARQKMREAKLGKKRSPHSPETKAKMSAAKLGKKATEETKQKLSLAMLGRVLPPEVRLKMSIAQKARFEIVMQRT